MEVDETVEEVSEEKRTPKFRVRPNFFVAVQVSNPAIHHAVCNIQNVVVSKEPLYKSILIKLITLHITLCTLHLPGNTEIKRAKLALNKLEEVMKDSLVKCPITLKFKGIGSFRNEVVFAKVEPGEPLTQLGDIYACLTNALKDEGFTVDDKFKPHLTIMKMSKDGSLRKRKIFKIPKNLYNDDDDMVFGDQTIRSIQLLKMGDHEEDSYYNCYHSIDMGTSDAEIGDHQDCCGVQSVIPTVIVELPTEEEEAMGHKGAKNKETLDEEFYDKKKSRSAKRKAKFKALKLKKKLAAMGSSEVQAACDADMGDGHNSFDDQSVLPNWMLEDEGTVSEVNVDAVCEIAGKKPKLDDESSKNDECNSSKEKINLENFEIAGEKTEMDRSEFQGTCNAEMVDDQSMMSKSMAEETRDEDRASKGMSSVAVVDEIVNKIAKSNEEVSKDAEDGDKEKSLL